MQPPIPTGTILQNRYRLISILGQGGFGRTYLAEDQGRFNEQCALKELIPSQGNAATLEKSRELFQREAMTLYQIQHPQIPQFRATFEQDQRLFLVQDFVEGKTYRTLLEERRAKGYAFSEPEVVLFLQQMLPVLEHIHNQKIIHRDLSPENIILRDRDHLPILIDFGVVKELATRIQATDLALQATSVGKLGYAPQEQLQTGRAYPSSDLYALAVTAIVLLTGYEPQDLYDDTTLSWQWQQRAQVTPGFAQVLQRMLSPRPGDRYQSAMEVSLALQSIQMEPAHAAASPPSQMNTIAVGRPAPTTPIGVPTPSATAAYPTAPKSIWEDTWALVIIGIVLSLATGLGSWAFVSAWINRSKADPIPTSTVPIFESPVVTTAPTEPVPTPTPTPSPPPVASPTPVAYSQRLDLIAGDKTTIEGSLNANDVVTYIIPGQQGDTFTAYVSGDGVLMTVLAPDQKPVNDRSTRVSAWEATLPETGDYQVQLSPVKGLKKGTYKLDVQLASAPVVSPSPTPSLTIPPSPLTSPLSTPVSVIEEELIVLVSDGDSQQLSGQVGPQVIKRYRISAEAGQFLGASVQSGNARLNIRYPNDAGQLVAEAVQIRCWESQVPRTGEYQVDVLAAEVADYVVDLNLSTTNVGKCNP